MSYHPAQPLMSSQTASGAPHRAALPPLSGLPATAEVLTRSGYRPAGQLSAGEDVITRDRGLAPILGATRITARSRMVRFAANALGADRPDCDLILPAHQLVLIRDWRAGALFGKHEARVQAAALVDEGFITDDGMQEVDCVQLRLATPLVLYLRGMEVLSAHGFDDHLQPQI